MRQKRIVTIAYSRQGGEISFSLLQGLRERGYCCDGYLFEKYRKEGLFAFGRAENIIAACFRQSSGIIFVCAMGIAVRQICGFIQSKQTDSAVLVVDEMGKFVIPVLSGHLGGANELARECAELTGAVPVITTATDLHGRFAVDVFAVKNHLVIDDMKLAKSVSADILNSQTISVYLEECYVTVKPDGTELKLISKKNNQGKAGIVISPYCQQKGTGALHLIPSQVILGVGCRKGISASDVESAVADVMKEYQIDWRAVCCVCTIDIKKEELGLLEFCRRRELPLQTFNREELAKQEGEFTGSTFVQDITGVDNVCERSAMAGGGERLIVPKQKREGVTVAAAVFRVGLNFRAN